MGYFGLNIEENWNIKARKINQICSNMVVPSNLNLSFNGRSISITSSYKHLTFSQDLNWSGGVHKVDLNNIGGFVKKKFMCMRLNNLVKGDVHPGFFGGVRVAHLGSFLCFWVFCILLVFSLCLVCPMLFLYCPFSFAEHFTSLKPNTHKLYIARQCLDIVYFL